MSLRFLVITIHEFCKLLFGSYIPGGLLAISRDFLCWFVEKKTIFCLRSRRCLLKTAATISGLSSAVLGATKLKLVILFRLQILLDCLYLFETKNTSSNIFSLILERFLPTPQVSTKQVDWPPWDGELFSWRCHATSNSRVHCVTWSLLWFRFLSVKIIQSLQTDLL
jgi:hypothetical protein